jgi:Bacterial sugar transferase
MQRGVECDLYYIDNWSFCLDLRIIVMTLFSKTAYTNAYWAPASSTINFWIIPMKLWLFSLPSEYPSCKTRTDANLIVFLGPAALAVLSPHFSHYLRDEARICEAIC